MPEVGGGESKADVYYDVIRKFTTNTWNSFVRQKLKLPENVIDDIENDHRSAQEQKYQMLLRWEQMNGYGATKESLRELARSHLVFPERGTNISVPQPGQRQVGQQPTYPQRGRAFVQETPDPSLQATPQNTAPAAVVTSHGMAYRRLLEAISDMLTVQNLETIKRLYSFATGSTSFQSAAELFFYLDDHNLWGRNEIEEKLNIILENMYDMGRNDIVEFIYSRSARMGINMQRNFDGSVMQASTRYSTIGEGYPNFARPGDTQNDALLQDDQTNPMKVQSRVTSSTRSNNQLNDVVDAGTVPVSSSLFKGGPAVHVQNMTINMAQDSSAFSIDSKRVQNNESNSGTQPGAKAHTTVNTRMEASVADVCTFTGDMNVEDADQSKFDEHIFDDRIYPIRNNPKGHVLILSNTQGFKWGPQHDRKGGEQDVKIMKDLWEQLGCKVICRENQSAENMDKLLRNFAGQRYHINSDFSVVIIMTHGAQTESGASIFYGIDGQPMSAEIVVDLFDNHNCKNLQKKPKLFLFQFCRGVKADQGAPDATDHILQESLKRLSPSGDDTDAIGDRPKLPSRSDIHVTYSTLSGNLSFRDSTSGSWFINAVANVFMRRAKNTHVADMLTEVKCGIINRTSNTPSNPDTHGCKEMAESIDLLTKKLFIFPGFPQEPSDDPDLME